MARNVGVVWCPALVKKWSHQSEGKWAWLCFSNVNKWAGFVVIIGWK